MLRPARGHRLVHLPEPVLDLEVEVPRTVVALGIAYPERTSCQDAHPLIDGGDGVDMELLLLDGLEHLVGDYQVAHILNRDDDTLFAAEPGSKAGAIKAVLRCIHPVTLTGIT